jgi:arylsulfatase A-like enzyme
MDTVYSRRDFIRTGALGSAALALSAQVRGQPTKLPRKPNLIVFLPDQLRADTVFGENAKVVHAPNIHKLASQSVVFNCAYVTQPICAPSRSSLLSGTWPHANSCTNNQDSLSLKFKCLPELIGDPDYRTGYFGKWHLGDEFSAQRGFQEWASTEEDFKSPDSDRQIDGISDYSKFLISKGYHPDTGEGKYFSYPFVSKLSIEVRKPKFLEDRACKFLEAARDRPFVMFIAFFEPHPPYMGPLNNEHALESIALDPTNGQTFGTDIPLRSRVLQEFYRKELRTPGAYRQTKQRYFGLIAEIDRCIGGILTKVSELALTDRTIVVLTSDHGDMMGAHDILGKRLMFEQSARVPYLVKMPEQDRSVEYALPISHIDFVPTMLDLLGKSSSSQCVGQSRAKLIRGETPPAPGLVFLEWCPAKEHEMTRNSKLGSKEQIRECLKESTRAVVSPDGWKLCLRDKDTNELYNLREDSSERHNRYSDSASRDVVQRLTGEIHRWQEQTGDTLKV